MFGEEHRGHQFEHLQTVYERHVEMIRTEASGLRRRLKELNALMHAVENNIERVTKSKEERAAELRNALEQMQARLDVQLKAKLITLLGQKTSMAEEIEMMGSMLHELNRQLSTATRSKLISKSGDLLRTLQEVQRKPTAQFAKAPVAADFVSEVIPRYECGMFRIRSYSKLRSAADVIYSEPLHAAGLTWRLKVYPNGNGVARGQYISVFLEMLRGLSDTSKYEYRVEMMNHRNGHQCIIREFASDFEVGECWGYNRFCRIDQLYKDGYVLPEEDVIVLRFYVRAPTFFQQCRDQRRYLEQLEAKCTQQQTLIAELSEKLVNSRDDAPPPPEPSSASTSNAASRAKRSTVRSLDAEFEASVLDVSQLGSSSAADIFPSSSSCNLSKEICQRDTECYQPPDSFRDKSCEEDGLSSRPHQLQCHFDLAELEDDDGDMCCIADNDQAPESDDTTLNIDAGVSSYPHPHAHASRVQRVPFYIPDQSHSPMVGLNPEPAADADSSILEIPHSQKAEAEGGSALGQGQRDGQGHMGQMGMSNPDGQRHKAGPEGPSRAHGQRGTRHKDGSSVIQKAGSKETAQYLSQRDASTQKLQDQISDGSSSLSQTLTSNQEAVSGSQRSGCRQRLQADMDETSILSQKSGSRQKLQADMPDEAATQGQKPGSRQRVQVDLQQEISSLGQRAGSRQRLHADTLEQLPLSSHKAGSKHKGQLELQDDTLSLSLGKPVSSEGTSQVQDERDGSRAKKSDKDVHTETPGLYMREASEEMSHVFGQRDGSGQTGQFDGQEEDSRLSSPVKPTEPRLTSRSEDVGSSWDHVSNKASGQEKKPQPTENEAAVDAHQSSGDSDAGPQSRTHVERIETKEEVMPAPRGPPPPPTDSRQRSRRQAMPTVRSWTNTGPGQPPQPLQRARSAVTAHTERPTPLSPPRPACNGMKQSGAETSAEEVPIADPLPEAANLYGEAEALVLQYSRSGKELGPMANKHVTESQDEDKQANHSA